MVSNLQIKLYTKSITDVNVCNDVHLTWSKPFSLKTPAPITTIHCASSTKIARSDYTLRQQQEEERYFYHYIYVPLVKLDSKTNVEDASLEKCAGPDFDVHCNIHRKSILRDSPMPILDLFKDQWSTVSSKLIKGRFLQGSMLPVINKKLLSYYRAMAGCDSTQYLANFLTWSATIRAKICRWT